MAILGETALSFLGIGLRPPVTSWGVVLNEAQDINVIAVYPWLLLPVIPLFLVVLAFNFLGDGLRDAADPYNRSEEHTSELQSLMRISYAVFCLKKKTIAISNTRT